MIDRLEAKRCSRCDAPFECGARAESCWCQQLPSLPADALDTAADCLCPQCLAAATQALQARTEGVPGVV